MFERINVIISQLESITNSEEPVTNYDTLRKVYAILGTEVLPEARKLKVATNISLNNVAKAPVVSD